MNSGRKQNIFIRPVSALLVCALVFSVVLPKEAIAARSHAGGGDISEYGWKEFGTTVGMAAAGYVAGAVVGGVVGGAWNSATGSGTFTGTLGSSLSNMGNFSNLAAGWNTYMACTQVSRAAGMAGAYYDWDKSTTYVVAGVASGIAGGLINSAAALGSSGNQASAVGATNETNMVLANTTAPASSSAYFASFGKGAVVGGVAGAASSGVIVSIDRERIDDGKNPRAGTQILGMVTGVVAANMARVAIDPPDKQGKVVTQQDEEKTRLDTADELDKQAGKDTPSLAKAAKLEADAEQLYKEGMEEGTEIGYAKIKTARDLQAKAAELRGEAQAKGEDTSAFDKLHGEATKLRGEVRQMQEARVKAQADLAKANDLVKQAEVCEAKAATASGKEVYEQNKTAELYRQQAAELRAEANETLIDNAKVTVREVEIKDGLIKTGKRIDTWENTDHTKLKAIAPGYYKTVDTESGLSPSDYIGRILKAGFVDSFNGQSLPNMLARAAAIVVYDKFLEHNEEKEYMEPFIKGVVQGATLPLFSGLANIYGLDPSLYVGSEDDVIEANVKYDYGKLLMARNANMNDKLEKWDPEFKKLKDIDAEHAKALKTIDEDVMASPHQKVDLVNAENERYVKKYDAQYVHLKEVCRAGSIEDRDFVMLNPRELREMAPKERYKAIAEAMGKALPEKDPLLQKQSRIKTDELARYVKDDKFNPLGLVRPQEEDRLLKRMNLNKYNVSEALGKIGISNEGLFFSNLWKGALAGVFINGVSGGMESAFDKWSTKWDPESKTRKNRWSDASTLATSYGINMGSAVLRGILQYYFWDNINKAYDWQDRGDYVYPEFYYKEGAEDPYTKDGQKNPDFNYIGYMLQRTNYATDLLKFYDFLRAAGFKPGKEGLEYHREREVIDYSRKYFDRTAKDGLGDWVEGGAMKPDPRWVASLYFNKPKDVGKAIAASIEQAMVESFYKTFAFGRPLLRETGRGGYGIEAEQVSALAFTDYLNYLRYISGYVYSQGGAEGKGGHAAVLNYLLTKGNLDTAGNNTLGALTSINFRMPLLGRVSVADTFGVRPERLVFTSTRNLVRTGELTDYDYGVKLHGRDMLIEPGLVEDWKGDLKKEGTFTHPSDLPPGVLDSEGLKALDENGRKMYERGGREVLVPPELPIEAQEKLEKYIKERVVAEGDNAGTWARIAKDMPELRRKFYAESTTPNLRGDIETRELLIALVPPMAEYRERILKFNVTATDYIRDWYKSSPMPTDSNLFYTIQTLKFEGGQGMSQTTTWVPYPNPLYGVRPQTGTGDYLKSKNRSE